MDQIESPNPPAAEMPSTSQQSASTSHQLTLSNFKPPSTQPYQQDVHAPSSSHDSNNTSTSQQHHPPPSQLFRIQQEESAAIGSSGMESEFSETDYMSAESGDELHTSTRVYGEQETVPAERAYGATFDKNRARFVIDLRLERACFELDLYLKC